MTITLGVSLLVIAILAMYAFSKLYLCEAEKDRYMHRWEQCIYGSMYREAWIHRDLIPAWEKRYPHIRNMNEDRKCGEWLTFCANYPTRKAKEDQLSGQKVLV